MKLSDKCLSVSIVMLVLALFYVLVVLFILGPTASLPISMMATNLIYGTYLAFLVMLGAVGLVLKLMGE